MNNAIHSFHELFAQLGLPNENHEIAHFLTTHASIADGFRLPDAPYWTRSQAAFLRESLLQDSEWSGLVDQLSKALCSPPMDTAGELSMTLDQRNALNAKEDPAQSRELERQQDA